MRFSWNLFPWELEAFSSPEFESTNSNKMAKDNPLLRNRHQEYFDDKIWVIEENQITCILKTIRYLQSKGWNDSDSRKVAALNQRIPIVCVMQLQEESFRIGGFIDINWIHEDRNFKVMTRQHDMKYLKRILSIREQSNIVSRTEAEIYHAAKYLSEDPKAIDEIDHCNSVSIINHQDRSGGL